MAVPMSVDDLIQVSIFGTLFGQRILSVLHYRVSVAPAGPSAELELQDLVNTIASRPAGEVVDEYIQAAAPEYSMDYIRCQKVKPVRTIWQSSIVGLAGEQTGAAKTANSAASLEKQSTHIGHKGIGRLQFAPVPSAQMNNGFLDPAYVSGEMTALGDSMINTISGTAYAAGRFKPCLPAGGADHSYDLFDVFPMNTVRTMHRRTLYLGE